MTPTQVLVPVVREAHERASDHTARLLDEYGEATTRDIIRDEIAAAEDELVFWRESASSDRAHVARQVDAQVDAIRYWKRVRRAITDIVRSDDRHSAYPNERRRAS